MRKFKELIILYWHIICIRAGLVCQSADLHLLQDKLQHQDICKSILLLGSEKLKVTPQHPEIIQIRKISVSVISAGYENLRLSGLLRNHYQITYPRMIRLAR